MHIYRLAVMLLLCATLASCGTYTPGYTRPTFTGPSTFSQEPMAAFDQAELAAAIKPGHAIVRGQAFSKTVGGDVKYGAGNTIVVLPNTAYTAECISIIAVSPSGCTDKMKPYARTVQADGEGRFEVDGLSPGSYLLSTVITWGVPSSYGIRTTGGPVTNTAEVAADTDIVTVNLN